MSRFITAVLLMCIAVLSWQLLFPPVAEVDSDQSDDDYDSDEEKKEEINPVRVEYGNNWFPSDTLVPNTQLLNSFLKIDQGRRMGSFTGLHPLFAYEYPDEIVVLNGGNAYGTKVKCLYFDGNNKSIGYGVDSIVVPEFEVHCAKFPTASYMSLSSEYLDPANYEPVKIIPRMLKDPVHYLSACISPTSLDWLKIAESVEHYKLQGVTHFFFYMHKIDDFSKRLLDFYVENAEMELIYFEDRFNRPVWEMQQVRMQDCILRARGYSQWVTMVDLDELITPTGYSGTIETYLKSIADASVGSIRIRNRLIFTDSESTSDVYKTHKQVLQSLTTLRYRNTSQLGPPNHATKCIFEPKKVLQMGVHYAELFYPEFQEVSAKANHLVVRHYTDDNSEDLNEVRQRGKIEMTEYPAKFMKPLIVNVMERLNATYGTEKT